MSNSPSPLNGRNLTRAGVAGAVLALLGIVLFVVLWVVLGTLKIRMLCRVCSPRFVFPRRSFLRAS